MFEAAVRSDALQQLETGIEEGRRVLTLTGTAGGAKALAIAKAILVEDRPTAVITPSNADAHSMALELKFYLDLLSPSPPDIVHLPSFEVDPYRGLSPHPEISAARAKAIWQLFQDGPRVLVTSARAASIRLHAPQRFLNYCLMLKQGEELSLDLIREHLYESGYVEDDPVTDPGEFSVRGGILDIFPPHLEKPARLEFFGDQIESIRIFDVDSQRSVEAVNTMEIIPMREYCFRRELLREWAEKVPSLWSDPFLTHLEEELALARHGETFQALEFHLPAIDPLEKTLFDYIRGYRIITLEHEVIENSLDKHNSELYQRFVDRTEAQKPVLSPEQIYIPTDEFRKLLDPFPRIEVEELSVAESESSAIYFASQSTRKYHGNIRELIGDLKKFLDSGEKIALVFSNLGRAERMNDILKEYEIPAHFCRAGEKEPIEDPQSKGEILLSTGNLHAGYYLPSINLRVLTSKDLFDESDVGPGPRKIKAAQKHLFISDFRDLKPGDYVVHIDHGIGLFSGLKTIGIPESAKVGGRPGPSAGGQKGAAPSGAKEFVLLTYQGEARLYVPVERLDLIQKYSSMGGTRPTLDRLGGTSWARTKSRIRKSMRDMAEELLKLYAQRQTVSGFGFSPDTAWQQEFEDAFEFELTRDQVDALEAVKSDMEAPRPMDRLLCGDV